MLEQLNGVPFPGQLPLKRNHGFSLIKHPAKIEISLEIVEFHMLERASTPVFLYYDLMNLVIPILAFPCTRNSI